MLIRSMAGDFEISIETFEIENGRLIMVGRMGVWDARTYITPRELIGRLCQAPATADAALSPQPAIPGFRQGAQSARDRGGSDR